MNAIKTTAALLADYNAAATILGEKQVSRFADRATAEKRTAAIVARLPKAAPAKKAAKAAYVRGVCPNCGGTEDITTGTCVDREGKQEIINEHIATHHSCGHQFNYDTGRTIASAKGHSASAVAAIAASWQDPAVRADRLTRVGCVVSGFAKGGTQSYASVPKAFIALGLSMGCMIKTRMAMKATGSAEFGGYTFKKA